MEKDAWGMHTDNFETIFLSHIVANNQSWRFVCDGLKPKPTELNQMQYGVTIFGTHRVDTNGFHFDGGMLAQKPSEAVDVTEIELDDLPF